MNEEKNEMNYSYDDNVAREIEIEIEEVKPLPFSERLVALFVSPTKLFENVKEAPVIALQLVLSLILGMIATYLVLDITLRNDVSIAVAAQAANMDVETLIQTSKIMALVTAPIGLILAPVITSLVIMLFCKMFKGQATFKQYFSASLHVMIVTTLIGIVTSLICVFTQSPLNFLSLAPLFAQDTKSFMFLVANTISVGTIWNTILTYFFVKVLNDFDRSKAIIVTGMNFALGFLFSAIPLLMQK